MKKLSILLLIALLTCCLFLVACGGNSNPGNGDGGENPGPGEGGEGGEGGENENGYTVIVKDQFGNPIEGINLQICYGDVSLGNCLKPKDTDSEGKAFYSSDATLENARVQINRAPANAVLPDGYVFFESDSKTLEITLNLVKLYTVYAKNEAGEVISHVEITVFSSETNKAVGTYEVDAEGKCDLALEPGSYYLEIKAKNSAFVFTNPDNGTEYHTIGEEESFTAIFSESENEIPYEIKVVDSDGNPIEGVNVCFYSMEYANMANAVTNQNGQVEVLLANGNYFAVAEVSKDKNAQVFIFEKNNTSKGEITVYNVSAGGMKSNAIMILGQSELTIEAGKTMWLCVYNPNGVTVSIAGDDSLAISGEGTYADGTFTFKELKGDRGYIKVVNNGDIDVTLVATIDGTLEATPY